MCTIPFFRDFTPSPFTHFRYISASSHWIKRAAGIAMRRHRSSIRPKSTQLLNARMHIRPPTYSE
eukprot:4436977-Pleurochrysis_carterae.AAC.1